MWCLLCLLGGVGLRERLVFRQTRRKGGERGRGGSGKFFRVFRRVTQALWLPPVALLALKKVIYIRVEQRHTQRVLDKYN